MHSTSLCVLFHAISAFERANVIFFTLILLTSTLCDSKDAKMFLNHALLPIILIQGWKRWVTWKKTKQYTTGYIFHPINGSNSVSINRIYAHVWNKILSLLPWKLLKYKNWIKKVRFERVPEGNVELPAQEISLKQCLDSIAENN